MIEHVINARTRDLGDFNVRRLLPYATHRMVGPFIFFDHMGPVDFKPGAAMDVRPHPHIHLATVTYLFEGVIHHRDSLGSEQLIEPGAINWMTAGRGIVHSERSPEAFRQTGGRLHGIQCWVALPEAHEDIEPAFVHHPAKDFQEFSVEGASLKLLLGKAFGRISPVKVHSDLFYLEGKLAAGRGFNFKSENREAAAYVVDGAVRFEGQEFAEGSLVIFSGDPRIETASGAHLMFLGGENIGTRSIFWNFVSSNPEKLEQAKLDWKNGPGEKGSRFPKIQGDDKDFIPLPKD